MVPREKTYKLPIGVKIERVKAQVTQARCLLRIGSKSGIYVFGLFAINRDRLLAHAGDAQRGQALIEQFYRRKGFR